MQVTNKYNLMNFLKGYPTQPKCPKLMYSLALKYSGDTTARV